VKSSSVNFGSTINVPAPIRTPDDAARLGLYQLFSGGLLEFIYYAFSESDLIKGFPALDWNGQPLVTLKMPNGKQIPQDGYENHGGYTSAATQAVQKLVQMRLWDPKLEQKFITDASHSDYPVTVSKNLGEALKKLKGKPFSDDGRKRQLFSSSFFLLRSFCVT